MSASKDIVEISQSDWVIPFS